MINVGIGPMPEIEFMVWLLALCGWALIGIAVGIIDTAIFWRNRNGS